MKRPIFGLFLHLADSLIVIITLSAYKLFHLNKHFAETQHYRLVSTMEKASSNIPALGGGYPTMIFVIYQQGS